MKQILPGGRKNSIADLEPSEGVRNNRPELIEPVVRVGKGAGGGFAENRRRCRPARNGRTRRGQNYRESTSGRPSRRYPGWGVETLQNGSRGSKLDDIRRPTTSTRTLTLGAVHRGPVRLATSRVRRAGASSGGCPLREHGRTAPSDGECNSPLCPSSDPPHKRRQHHRRRPTNPRRRTWFPGPAEVVARILRVRQEGQ